MPRSVTPKKLNSSMKIYKTFWLIPKKDVFFIIGGWNAKVGSQETLGVPGKFGLGVWNEGGQRLKEFCQENGLVIAKHPLATTQENIIHGHHQMVITEIKLIIFSAAKDGVSKNKTRSWLWLRSWTPYWQIQMEIEESGENY